MYTLNICIPTYNRKNKVDKMVSFLIREFSDYSTLITVRDNDSSDDTYNYIKEKYAGISNFEIIKNESNLGLGGNVIECYQKSVGKYIWVIGDDDLIKEGIANLIFTNLESKREVGCYFINHKAIRPNGQVIFDSAYDHNKIYAESLLGIFKDNGSVMMFLSSMIYDREDIQNIIDRKPHFFRARLTIPLFAALITAEKHDVCFISNPDFIDNVHDTTSWQKDGWKVFAIGVPLELYRVAILTRQLYPLYLMVNYFTNRAMNKLKRSIGLK